MATQPKFQTPAAGLGSYLNGILPEDLAVSAGAFSMAMQQIRNIHNADFEKFAQVAASIEVVTTNLNLTNGTDVPVNLPKTAEDTTILALGSGPHGTYTMSDCFGCMSGLPYSWRELRSTILQAETRKLTNIYQELFLAVTWEGAEVEVILETRQVLISAGPPPVYQTEYRCAGFSVINKGGGYGRGTAPDPIIIASNGGSGLGIVGRSPPASESLGGKTYGRITGCTLTSPGSWELSPPTVVSIQYPPTATLPVQSNGNKATGGSNTAYGTVGWGSPMNAVVQQYIDQANAEIVFIKSSKAATVRKLNTIWDYNGKQLEIEQRTRYQALDPVPIPRNRWMSTYPTTISTFVDGMHVYAQSTRPHMYAQTIEAISDLKTVCGQSAVALMRQERNNARLAKLGIPLENIVPGKIESELTPVLISNGTVPAAKTAIGIEINGINGNPVNPTTTYTVPATMVQQLNDPPLVAAPAGQPRSSTRLTPKPMGYYDPNTNNYVLVPKTTTLETPNSIQNILNVEKLSPNSNVNLLGPSRNGTGPAKPKKSTAIGDPSVIQSGISSVSLNPLLTAALGITTGTVPGGSIGSNAGPVVNTTINSVGTIGAGTGGGGTGGTGAGTTGGAGGGGAGTTGGGSGGAGGGGAGPAGLGTGGVGVSAAVLDSLDGSISAGASPGSLLGKVSIGPSMIIGTVAVPPGITIGATSSVNGGSGATGGTGGPAGTGTTGPGQFSGGAGAGGGGVPIGSNTNFYPGFTITGINGANPGSPYGVNVIETEPIAVVVSGAVEPTGDGYLLDSGKPTFPGSFAGTSATDILPPELNAAYTSAVLLPTTLTVSEAINEVINCNCDCWID